VFGRIIERQFAVDLATLDLGEDRRPVVPAVRFERATAVVVLGCQPGVFLVPQALPDLLYCALGVWFADDARHACASAIGCASAIEFGLGPQGNTCVYHSNPGNLVT